MPVIDPKKIAALREASARALYPESPVDVPRRDLDALLAEREDFVRDLSDRQALLDMLSAVRAALKPDPKDGRSIEAVAQARMAEREEVSASLAREGFSVVERDGRAAVVRVCTCTMDGTRCPMHREEELLALLRDLRDGIAAANVECYEGEPFSVSGHLQRLLDDPRLADLPALKARAPMLRPPSPGR